MPMEPSRSNAIHPQPTRLGFFKFLAVGGFSATINFGSRIIFSHYVSYGMAIVFAYILGMLTAFVLNKLLIFKHTHNALLIQMAWFLAVNAVALAQTLLISIALTDYVLPWLGWQWHRDMIAHAFGVVMPVITSYFGHKHFSFRQHHGNMANHA